MQITAIVILLFTIHFHFLTGTSHQLKCSHAIVFQKILGLRPARQGRTTSDTLPLYVANPSRPGEAVNVKCAQICREDPTCYGYLLVFSQNICYGYTANATVVATAAAAAAAATTSTTTTISETYYDYIDESSHQLVADVNVAFFVKTCLDVPHKCVARKLFPLVTIPGASLVGQNFVQLAQLVTRNGCMNACLRERKFACRSARFVHSFRNNRHRLWEKSGKLQLGQCFLSRNDRFTSPESFRRSWEDEEYLENQCHGLEPASADCSFEQHRDVAFIYPDESLVVADERSCAERCLNEELFTCLGYTYRNSSNNHREPPICFLHSDDLITLGPKAVRVTFNSVYSRRLLCLNVQTQCHDDRIKLDYESDVLFEGRVYLNTAHTNCSRESEHNGTLSLEITTGDEITESRCGIRRAFIKGNVQNFLVFGYVCIQTHPLVRTQADRMLKVGCIHTLKSPNMTSLMKTLPMRSTVDFIPHSQSFSFGSIEISNGTSKALKHLTTHLIDVETQAEIFEATIGQLIEMQILSADRDFDLSPYSLVAYTLDETLSLLDDKGCPLDRRLFPGFRKQKTSTGITLSARFHAFVFPSSRTLQFRLTIKFCHDVCPKVVCFYQ
ncbi:uncharacterized protein LOC129763327 isoform X2 [Toxorhynchites rutilus septentrionalis]|uniref:uncharacterized protein LOC129763327 isoform X2 n=1 Tax=Toxorhynchites rutilus septentrionalis TaxID=329112 RepID=UPI002478BD69|nr:uncharacterized protein LOC129763327 isoform X2 [Toxorhynchites rutilus septentrionalis]